jgi:hypothetical protein
LKCKNKLIKYFIKDMLASLEEDLKKELNIEVICEKCLD